MSAHRQNFKPEPAGQMQRKAVHVGAAMVIGIAIAAIALQWCLAEAVGSVG